MGQNRHFPAMPQNTKRQLVYYANYSLGYNRTSPNSANHPVCVGGSNIPKTNLTQRKVENIDKSPYVINGLTDPHVLVVLPFPVFRDHIPHTSPNCNQTGKFSKILKNSLCALWAYYNCDTSTIRVRFDYDSATTRYEMRTIRVRYNILRGVMCFRAIMNMSILSRCCRML